MIVVDASAVVDLLLAQPAATAVAEALRRNRTAHAPHVIDPEVVNALRRLTMQGEVTEARAAEAVEDFVVLPIVRHAHAQLTDRVWELRERFTAYDASYVALAELFGAELVTTDPALAKSARSLVSVAGG